MIEPWGSGQGPERADPVAACCWVPSQPPGGGRGRQSDRLCGGLERRWFLLDLEEPAERKDARLF